MRVPGWIATPLAESAGPAAGSAGGARGVEGNTRLTAATGMVLFVLRPLRVSPCSVSGS